MYKDLTGVRRNVRSNQTIDLLEIARSLWKRAWLIILASILGAAVAAACAIWVITPMYSSSVMFYVNNISNDNTEQNGYINTNELTAAQNLAETYMVILQTEDTLNAVIEDSKLNYTFSQVNTMVSAEAVNETEIFRVTVKAANRNDVVKLTKSIEKILPEKVDSIVNGSSMRVVKSADETAKKESPSVIRYSLNGFLIGFLLLSAIIVMLKLVDDTITGEDDLSKNYNYPVLALIPDMTKKNKNGYGKYCGSYGYGYGTGSLESTAEKGR